MKSTISLMPMFHLEVFHVFDFKPLIKKLSEEMRQLKEDTKKSTKKKEESQFQHKFVMQSNDNTQFYARFLTKKAVEGSYVVFQKTMAKGQHKNINIEARPIRP